MKPLAALPPDAELVEAVLSAALVAASIVLDVRRRGHSVEHKADSTPVTEADRAAEAAILDRLTHLAPGTPVVAEEACAAGHLPDVGRTFFLVDALDGTKEYVRGGSDFTVNIALIRDHVPVLGVVVAPACGDVFFGVASEGAWSARFADGRECDRAPIRVRSAVGPIDVVASRSHRTPETDAYIARYPVRHLVSTGSSLKFCLLAAGKADLYPRMGTTMQWDTAAGDAVLRAAGGQTMTLDDDAPLNYGPNGAGSMEAYRNPWFVAVGDSKLLQIGNRSGEGMLF